MVSGLSTEMVDHVNVPKHNIDHHPILLNTIKINGIFQQNPSLEAHLAPA